MKAKSENSVSAYARVSGAKASPQCSRAESESWDVFRFSGEIYARKRIVVFVFPRRLSGFNRAVLSWRWIVGRKSARDTGMGLRFGSRNAGATRTARRGENTACNAIVKRCALSRCSSFVFMLSLDSGEKAPVFFFGL